MGNFEYNSLEDLVFSRSFRNWVLDRDSAEAGFWESWIAVSPERRVLANHAKAVIYALQLNLQKLSDEEINTEVRKALQRSGDTGGGFVSTTWLPDEAERGFPGATHFRGRTARRLEWAALFAGIFLTGWLLYRNAAPQHPNVLQSFLVSHKKDPIRQQTADTGSGRLIVLPDGSSVKLGPGSKLYYDKREVYLEGEAFFEIKRNATHPFYVYTGHVITKVLGTSFRVRAWSSDPRTTVTVRTGKVSVYRDDDFYAAGSGSGNKEPAGIVLTPNQEIRYSREGEDHRLKKTLADDPRPLMEGVATDPDTAAGRPGPMVFKGTPVPGVLRQLQEVYGIPILFDEETVASCTLFATLGTESFYEKLNVICKAINASYEVIDGNIVITAPGCK